MKLKWIVAIVINFGLLTMFYLFQWTVVLKSLLILSCVILIGCILMQAGRGGGLAAIGGLADQTALGTKTSTVLSKITYLVGASFIFTTILLTKLTLSSIHGTDTLRIEKPRALQETVHEHAAHEHAAHEPSQDVTGVGEEEESMGMKAVDSANEKQEN
ncbi:MAG: putative translocase subunit SecG [Candidatus Scalindua rubra]|uniref:Protein-export membrane protein SecG n=1 Tax=Candidatus Scalindua rubra TaxID=1872076 RepID=A0A1E3XG97_9BACT|nr:MAG: putative translocase subunit SecG [Candidatus Scalindua rubra]